MDHWTELAWESERDEADAYQAAADAAEGERLRVALEVHGYNWRPSWRVAQVQTADDLMATEWHRERARVWREGGPAPSQFDDDEPDLADETDAEEGSIRRWER